MSLTGGYLNYLNGFYGISAPQKSVPVMKLIKFHKPKSKEELKDLIEYHYYNKCDCGIISQGRIEDFGKNLYDAQFIHWGEYRYNLKECIQWEYNLFIVQSLKGNLMEDKAKVELSKELPKYIIESANDYVDEELRVDLIIKIKNKTICGIQVKPNSYKHVTNNIQNMNKFKNSLFKYPVINLYYNYSDESFSNIMDCVIEVKNCYK